MQSGISKSLIRKNFNLIKSPPKPAWIKIKLKNREISSTKNIISKNELNTVCEEAMCPNLHECWSKKHATFMILGDTCTRSCSFCNIKTGKPNTLDPFEPYRVANAVKKLSLKHVVITSVDRDDLSDGGADHFVKTINAIKSKSPHTTIEILTPDFRKKHECIKHIAQADIDIFNHNLETVKSLYTKVRPGAEYEHSLKILSDIKNHKKNLITKSGIMIGLGEKLDEVISLMDDLRGANVDFITIGQYLRPTINHHPVIKYHAPDYFDKLSRIASNKGFKMVASSPFTRSSYHADEDFEKLKHQSQ